MKFTGRVEYINGQPRAEDLRVLASYVSRQVNNLFPSYEADADAEAIFSILPTALERLKPILQSVRSFDSNCFSCFNSLQYSTFLYLLANQNWKTGLKNSLSDRIFCLNRALSSIDLYYAVQMPEVFFISHGVGTVLGNVNYGNRLVIFQNVTVGRVGDSKPTIGDSVILYPGVTITGNSSVGENSVLSAGVILHNAIIPDNTVVKMENGQIIFYKNNRNLINLYLN